MVRRIWTHLLDPRLVRFTIVGVASSVLFLVLAYALALMGLSPFVASLIAYAISFGASYVAQRGWTFGARHRHGHALPRYIILQLHCALASGLVAEGLVDLLGMSLWLMSILTTLFAGIISYIVSWLWVFPEAHGRLPDQ